MTQSDDIIARKSMLQEWLGRRLSSEQFGWLDDRIAKISDGGRASDLVMAIGLAPRKLGKADLNLSPDEFRAADDIRADLDASNWSVDQTARILFALASFMGDTATFAATLDRLFQSAEITEQIALLLGLPLYPAQELLVHRAAEGVRSTMQTVFEAVAHRSPLPKERFSEAQWNQMILKALFISSRLAPIQGLDERRNAELAETLMNYVHERWSAARSVSPELWRCVGPFARKEDIADLVRVLESRNKNEVAAAALALSECLLPEAQRMLERVPDLVSDITDKRITWDTIKV
jgi:hypothetical protein